MKQNNNAHDIIIHDISFLAHTSYIIWICFLFPDIVHSMDIHYIGSSKQVRAFGHSLRKEFPVVERDLHMRYTAENRRFQCVCVCVNLVLWDIFKCAVLHIRFKSLSGIPALYTYPPVFWTVDPSDSNNRTLGRLRWRRIRESWAIPPMIRCLRRRT